MSKLISGPRPQKGDGTRRFFGSIHDAACKAGSKTKSGTFATGRGIKKGAQEVKFYVPVAISALAKGNKE